MKKAVALIVLMVIVFAGCRQNKPTGNSKIQIITTLFPLYDFSRQVVGDKAEVVLLLPPGVEAHSFEPKPSDIVRISKADLFVYTGPQMEPWVEDLLKGIANAKLNVINCSATIELAQEGNGSHEEHESEADGHEGHDHGGKDPHIWLDPVLAQQIVSTIAVRLAQQDAGNAEFYMSNAAAYNRQLAALDATICATLNKCKTKTIIYGGHFAFGYFARRYGLDYLSPYAGFSPDAEPTPRKIAELIETLKKTGNRYIYFEELLEPRVAKTIAENTGAEMLLLHGAHNLSKQDLDSGVTYLEIMQANLERLKLGLGYQE